MRYLSAILLPLLLIAAPVAAADDDPIDQELDRCLQKPDVASTQAMVDCIGTAYDAWDKALNKAYGELMKTLTEEQRGLLRKAQRQWIAFRDAETEFLGSLQQPPAGSIMRLVANQALADLVKARALGLRSYKEPLSEQ